MKLPSEVDPKARDISFLDAYALERWECVLHYMVGSHQQEVISTDAIHILYHAGLMKKWEISKLRTSLIEFDFRLNF